MKYVKNVSFVFVVMLLGICLLGGQGFAKNDQDQSGNYHFTDQKLEMIEKNLILALNYPSSDVQASASQTLRQAKFYNPEYSFSSSIIPLMAIVKSESASTVARICAALALHDLKSERGDFAISQMARFTDDAKVKNICFWLTYERQKEKMNIKDDEGSEPLVLH